MTIHDDNPSSFFARGKTGVAALLVFLSLIFVFGWHKSVENARDAQALRKWTLRHAELSKEGDAEWRRLIAHFHSLQSKPGSQRAMEDELNGGAPFELRLLKANDYRHHEGQEAVEWSHPKYGGICTFYFREGVLEGLSGGWGGQPESLHPRPTLRADSNTAEWLRQHIARFGGYAWLAAIACWFAFSNRRVLAAQASLAAALACGMAWAVNPQFSITWSGLFSNDYLFFAVIMIPISVVILALTLTAEHSHKEAFRLQFGIRHIFIAITVVAILLAAGPFGYLTLVVGVIGCVLFAVVYFVNRAHRLATLRWMAKRGYVQP